MSGEECQPNELHGCSMCRKHRRHIDGHEYEEKVCLGCAPHYTYDDGWMGHDFGMRTKGHCMTRRVNHCYTQEMLESEAPEMFKMPNDECVS